MAYPDYLSKRLAFVDADTQLELLVAQVAAASQQLQTVKTDIRAGASIEIRLPSPEAAR